MAWSFTEDAWLATASRASGWWTTRACSSGRRAAARPAATGVRTGCCSIGPACRIMRGLRAYARPTVGARAAAMVARAFAERWWQRRRGWIFRRGRAAALISNVEDIYWFGEGAFDAGDRTFAGVRAMTCALVLAPLQLTVGADGRDAGADFAGVFWPHAAAIRPGLGVSWSAWSGPRLDACAAAGWRPIQGALLTPGSLSRLMLAQKARAG